jgi:hypothetical protein
MTVIQDTPDFQIVRTVLANGATADQIVYKPGPTLTAQTNSAALVSKANAALAANATFLALGAPTNPQVLAQVQLLTREVNALIRLFLSGDALQDVSNT